jgi:hypothetical protein
VHPLHFNYLQWFNWGMLRVLNLKPIMVLQMKFTEVIIGIKWNASISNWSPKKKSLHILHAFHLTTRYLQPNPLTNIFFPISVMFLVKPSLHIAAIMIAFKKSLVRIYLQKWMLHKDCNKTWTLLEMCKFDSHPEIFFCHNEVMLWIQSRATYLHTKVAVTMIKTQ